MFSGFSLKFLQNSLCRSFSSKKNSTREISPRLRFHMDTKAVYGPLQVVREKRSRQPSEFDLIVRNPTKEQFDNDTELLYGGSAGFYRACSLPKGVPISQRTKYLRDLFRIPRGQPVSRFQQAYVPNKYLGMRKKK